MIDAREELLTQLGFRFGANGPHAARTMMLDDLCILLSNTERQATREDYIAAILGDNVLGKPTRKSRELALKHMTTLYGLDEQNVVLRALRHLWFSDDAAQPMLALIVALARDPLLRSTRQFILNQSIGSHVAREHIQDCLSATFPEGFSVASRKSFAQNVGGTWTAADYLHGHKRKLRARPAIHPESVSMLLFMEFLEGRTGQRLFSSEWANLPGVPVTELEVLASSASHKGLLVFMNAGGVKEVRFPDFVTAEEEKIQQRVSHVI
ncbi:hypothetical protein [Comamonas sp. MYb69]|uniref:hypothetical protein n=1 Tax=Comamonas sp. MYb69 TaxID=1848650 RepID=UPI003095D4EB